MKKIIVKKPEELIRMKGDFSEGALKFSTYLISLIKPNVYEYNIYVRDYLKKTNKNINDFNYIYKISKELIKKTFEMVDRNKNAFAIFSFISKATYNDGVLTVKFDEELLEYLLEIKNKYLKYQISNIMSLDSKYSIRLYEILKNSYELSSRYKKNTKECFKIDELKEMLKIPSSYRWIDIKRQILDFSILDLKKTDICFDYKPIKTKNKVVEIEFNIFKNNPIKSIDDFINYLKSNYEKKYFGWDFLFNKGQWLNFNEKDSNLNKYNKEQQKVLLDIWYCVFNTNNKYKKAIIDNKEIKEMVKDQKFLDELKNSIIKCLKQRSDNGE